MTWRAWITLVAAGIVLAAAPPAGAGEGMLDGKTFVVEMGEVGTEEGEADDLVFTMGTFRSTGCDPYGFTAAPYVAMEKDGSIHFEAEAASPTEGRMVWKGVATGDAVEGSATWYKGDEKRAEYWYRGRLAD
jgi:hypothetical protein